MRLQIAVQLSLGGYRLVPPFLKHPNAKTATFGNVKKNGDVFISDYGVTEGAYIEFAIAIVDDNGQRRTQLRARDLRLANYMAWTGKEDAKDLKVIFFNKVEEPGARQATKAAFRARGGSGALHSQSHVDGNNYSRDRDYESQEITGFEPGEIGWAELMTNNRLLGGVQGSLHEYAGIYGSASIQKVDTVVYKGGSHDLPDEDGDDAVLMYVTYLKR
ncbi:Uu.00g019050.m01.CDS01 [Anthostomella pinea]|uniref:Uu.00g019050.m01.CDS01 n=1 Tax=Anthostomella pinea TaxID=933095 RepID=A0AAI8VZ88_9PEZI|nr:Uu.00g019050.m01.CDS01 [Anthostomella pinea]